jgi:hypothetical protein
MAHDQQSAAESMASTLFKHKRDHTSHILTTNDDSSFALTDTHDLIESAWNQAQTGQYMLKSNLLNWIYLHPVTQQVVLLPGSFDHWVDRHTESVAVLQQIRDARSEGVRLPGFDQDRDFGAQVAHDGGMQVELDRWGTSLVARSRLENRDAITPLHFAQACPAGVCLHLKNWYKAYTAEHEYAHADYVNKRLQTLFPGQYEDE